MKVNQQGTALPIATLVDMGIAAAVVWPYSTQVLPSKVDSLSNAVKQKNVPTLSHPGNFPELSPRETLSVGNSPHKILSCPGLYLVCVSSRKRSRTEAGTSPPGLPPRSSRRWRRLARLRSQRGGGLTDAEPSRRRTARRREDRGGGGLRGLARRGGLLDLAPGIGRL